MSLKIMGRLTKEPKVVRLENDRVAINFPIVIVDADYRNGESAFINDVVVFAHDKKTDKGVSQADVYLRDALVGSSVELNGLFHNTEYVDKKGVTHYGLKFIAHSAKFKKSFKQYALDQNAK